MILWRYNFSYSKVRQSTTIDKFEIVYDKGGWKYYTYKKLYEQYRRCINFLWITTATPVWCSLINCLVSEVCYQSKVKICHSTASFKEKNLNHEMCWCATGIKFYNIYISLFQCENLSFEGFFPREQLILRNVLVHHRNNTLEYMHIFISLWYFLCLRLSLVFIELGSPMIIHTSTEHIYGIYWYLLL